MIDEHKQYEELKQIVIARLETLNPDTKIIFMDRGEPLSVSDMLDEIRNDSDLGKKIVEVQLAYIKMLTSGEIDR